MINLTTVQKPRAFDSFECVPDKSFVGLSRRIISLKRDIGPSEVNDLSAYYAQIDLQVYSSTEDLFEYMFERIFMAFKI